MDPGTGTIAVRAVFPNPDGVLLPGQYVTVLISRQPAAAHAGGAPGGGFGGPSRGSTCWWWTRTNRVRQRRIAPGPEVGTGWAVESGLQPGETIIVHGLQRSLPGQKVRTGAPKPGGKHQP